MSNKIGPKIVLGVLLAVVIGMVFLPAQDAKAAYVEAIEIDGARDTEYTKISETNNYTLYFCHSEAVNFIYLKFTFNITEEAIFLRSGDFEQDISAAETSTSFLHSVVNNDTLELSVEKDFVGDQIDIDIDSLDMYIGFVVPIETQATIIIPEEEERKREEGYNIFTFVSDIKNNTPWYVWVLTTICGTLIALAPALISWRLKEHPIQVFDVLTGTPQKREHKKAGRWIREERSKIRNYMAHIYNSGSDGVTTIFSEDNQSTIRGNEWMNILRVIRLYPDYHLTERKLTEKEQYDNIYLEQNRRYKYRYRIMRHIPNKTIAMNSFNKLKRYRIAVCPICKNQVKLYIEKEKKKVKEERVKIDALKSRTPYLDGINEKNPIMICENEECESRKQKNKEPEKIEHIIEKVDSILFLELKINMGKVTTLCDVEYMKNVKDNEDGKIEVPMAPKGIPITTYLTLKNEDDSVVEGSLKITHVDFITTKHKSIAEAYKEQASMTEGRNVKAIELAHAYEDVEKLSNEGSALSDILIQLRAKLKRNTMDNILDLSRDFTDIIDLKEFGKEIFHGRSLGEASEIVIDRAIKKIFKTPIEAEEGPVISSLEAKLKKSEALRKELEEENLRTPFKNRLRGDKS